MKEVAKEYVEVLLRIAKRTGQRNKSLQIFNVSEGIKEHMFVNIQKKKVKIIFSDIAYIESQKEYVKIVTTTNEYVSKMSTHEIENLLPMHLFKRIHRSFIVATSKIDSYTSEMVEINGVSIPIGRAYRDIIANF